MKTICNLLRMAIQLLEEIVPVVIGFERQKDQTYSPRIAQAPKDSSFIAGPDGIFFQDSGVSTKYSHYNRSQELSPVVITVDPL